MCLQEELLTQVQNLLEKQELTSRQLQQSEEELLHSRHELQTITLQSKESQSQQVDIEQLQQQIESLEKEKENTARDLKQKQEVHVTKWPAHVYIDY